VRLLAELQVDDEYLGEIEGKREPILVEDRRLPERRGIRRAAQRDRPHGHAYQREHSVEDPDAPRRAEGLPSRGAERAKDLARRAERDDEGPDRCHRPIPLLLSPNLPRANCVLIGYASGPTRSEPPGT